MKKQYGFTLIELVIVIIILGILSVVVAPRYINIKTSANLASLDALIGSMKSANDLVYSKTAIVGKENDSGAIIEISETESVVTENGYLQATIDNMTTTLAADFEVLPDQRSLAKTGYGIWQYQEGAEAMLFISPKGVNAEQCYFMYYLSSSGDPRYDYGSKESC